MLDTWSIIESEFNVAHNRHYEGLLAIGSGTLQQRAALEEGLRDDPQDAEYLRLIGNVSVEQFPSFKSRVGTYLPGVSGPHPTCRDEMINLPALHGLIIYTAGERLDMESAGISAYRRWLDLRTGHLGREFTWLTHTGAKLRMRFERFISAHRRHVMALRCTIAHLDGPPAELRFLGPIDAEVRTNGFDHLESIDITGEHEPITLVVRTNSGIDVAAAALLTCDRGLAWSVEIQPRWVACCGGFTVDPGQTLVVDKFAAMTSSHHVSAPPLDVARKLAWDAAAEGFDQLAAESDAVWRARWEKTDVEIEGDPESQLALRVSLYHLLRAVVEDDPRCSIDAKAAAGEAYCGRYFWDSEIFMLPMFLYTQPDVGKTLARFRVVSLDGARRNAARLGYPGARYARESSPGGDENCPTWHAADHEVHITGDVAYGLWHAHLTNPNDQRFLRDATEVFIETARYWCERVAYDAEHDRYELLMVMGPDEYTPFNRNNAYTNGLAAFGLRLAAQAWREFAEADASGADELREQLDLRDEELARFEELAAKLHMPFDQEQNLVMQSDDFPHLEQFDFDRWWPDRSRRLGASVSQERLYRSQVLKQADVVQLLALLPHEFDAEQMRRAYEVYEPLTSHDSSLSRTAYALVAAWTGQDDEALRLWRASVGLDMQLGEAAEGIHAACAGGNWQMAVLGFGGVRTRMQTDILEIDPRLPKSWKALRFPFVWERQPLRITVAHAGVTIEHRGSQPLEARVCGQAGTLKPGETKTFKPAHSS